MGEGSAHDSDQERLTAQRRALVDHLKMRGIIQSAAVEAAFRAVPRHLFLPSVAPEEAYRDQVVPLKTIDGLCVSSSSQPAIMAIMLEQLELRPGMQVLEIGAASGYNAALMAYLVGESGRVVTMDLEEDLVEGARAHLQAAGFPQVQVVCGDGALGYPPAAPYDRIVLTVAAGDIAPAWYEQLKPDGRLLLPLALRDAQFSVALEPRGDHLESVSVRCCAFMMLRGSFAEAGGVLLLAPEAGLQLRLQNYQPLDAARLYRTLCSPWYDLASGVVATFHEIHFGFNTWLSQRDPLTCSLVAQRDTAATAHLPWLFKLSELEARSTIGLVEGEEIALLAPPPDWRAGGAERQMTQPGEIFVRCFGGDERLARRLIAHLRAWNEQGRLAGWYLFPGDEHIRISVYPLRPDEPAPQPREEGAGRLQFIRRRSRLLIEHLP
jgi:protein-L-isoaspartate(D-aspartate) O-methyltransferase